MKNAGKILSVVVILMFVLLFGGWAQASPTNTVTGTLAFASNTTGGFNTATGYGALNEHDRQQ